MAWLCPTSISALWFGGDFKGARNATLGDSLLRHQKRFAGLVAKKRGRYHADPLLAEFGMLKVSVCGRTSVYV